MATQYHYDNYRDDNSAWWKTALTLLSLVLFFVVGWVSNDLYQGSGYQTAPQQEFGVGGAPVVPTDIFMNPTEVPQPTREQPATTEEPTMTPEPTISPGP